MRRDADIVIAGIGSVPTFFKPFSELLCP